MPGTGICPLVLGECVQGKLSGGVDFLITAPIALYSRARFDPGLSPQGLTVDPPLNTKSLQAVARYLASHRLPERGSLNIQTPLPASHGFGTSTADITASIRAAAAAWGRRVTAEEISRIAIGIEPSDGSMYADSVAYAHCEGRLLERLGKNPAFVALATFDDQEVDTVEFDRQRKSFTYSARELDLLQEAWNGIRQANRTGDAALMAEACTLSTRINEQFLPKALFAEMHRLVEHGVGDGLIAAHSGSSLALILDPSRPDHEARYERARHHLEDLAPWQWFAISNRPPPADE
jgi:L-threonine kinase